MTISHNKTAPDEKAASAARQETCTQTMAAARHETCAQTMAASCGESTAQTRAASRAKATTRIAFTLVFLINVQCALQFVFIPESFAGAYELSGVAGKAAVAGMGVAFLMWNATYPPFIARPDRFQILGWVIIAQQVIGLIGETAILLSLPAGHEVLAASILRFICFDGGGLALMVAAFTWLIMSQPKKTTEPL
ncbi:MAG: hypothetical protein PUE49_02095 [Eggerthellales bacterium]|nr:hypothetical protein [Eggerthellales bacterium]